jgi:hypothetical protein
MLVIKYMKWYINKYLEIYINDIMYEYKKGYK